MVLHSSKIWVAAGPGRPLLECNSSRSSMQPTEQEILWTIEIYQQPAQGILWASISFTWKDSEWKVGQDVLKGVPVPLWEYLWLATSLNFQVTFLPATQLFPYISRGCRKSAGRITVDQFFTFTSTPWSQKAKRNCSTCILPQVFSPSPPYLVLLLQTATMTIASEVSFGLCGPHAESYWYYKAVIASAFPTRNVASDCSSYMAITVTPATK